VPDPHKAQVQAQPPGCREAFSFTVEDGRIRSFADRMVLIRAGKG
jgi:hypothetical protein